MTTTTNAPVHPTDVSARPALASAGLVTVLLGAALPVIDFFIVNVALPTIDADLHASTATLELVVAAYGIAYAVLLVLGGRLGDAFGRRRLFLVGLALFTLTSLVCGLAPDALTLVFARAAQGAASALLLPQVLSIIQAGTSGAHRSRALGYYGAMGGISTVVGQLLGGVLVAADLWGTSWRPIFLVNVPIGLVGLLVARRTVPDSRAANPLGVDRWGTALLAASLLSLLVPLMEGSALGWPWWTVALLVLFPFAVLSFARIESRLEARGGMPLLPPALVRTANVRHGLVAAVPFFCGFGSFMFVYAVTLQDGLHLGPLGSGLALTPMAVAYFLTSLVSSHLVARFGRKVVPIGGTILALGLLVLAGSAWLAWPSLSVWQLAPAMVLIGVGNGLAMTTLFRVVLSRVPHDLAGIGGGVMTTTQQTSLALGVAVFGSLFAGLSTGPLRFEGAFVLVIALLAVVALVVTGLARRLPDPR
ncbi:MFS transporter [Amycolatopsis sp. FDAARGOS 1241]|uniref:MFS transporter n=1 Tax=Amycolatopsis sp. FDAARGOS 1241 TaxID=2778070 RepID=UPI00194F2526|nr:MFS transporter [Amycolatopsis sp. FDAARGOS 1241]QRP45932.1 MFS transporter [Amycolatopsis sp. FDAARGOS 1241]